jgi:hypothetical protein
MSTNRRRETDPRAREGEAAPPAATSAGAAAEDPLARVAAAAGNHTFGAILRVASAGLLPGGAVHPDVEATIAATRGSGHDLDADVRERVAPALGDPLADVRVHTDSTADSLARAVDARAFATGRDVYFAAGEYRPGTVGGDSLLAHELAHVVQQRGAPGGGPLTVSQPGDREEVEADAFARELGD